jgi:hypothetical protein
MIRPDIIELFRVPPGKRLRLRDYDTGWPQTEELKELGKDLIRERARAILEKNLEDLAEVQQRLWADDRYNEARRPQLRGARSPPGDPRLSTPVRCHAHHPREHVGEASHPQFSHEHRGDNGYHMYPRPHREGRIDYDTQRRDVPSSSVGHVGAHAHRSR